jgi:GNAT superfamily N-acetyltransferase
MAEVRPLSADDWQIIKAARLRALRHDPNAFTSTFERESSFDEPTWRDRATTCQWFVATEGNQPVGIAGGLNGWSGDPSKRELVGMWVAPSHRRQGVALALLDRVARWAKSEGASTLCLGVLEDNPGARAAYLGMGLRPTGETTAVQDDPTRTIEVMRVDL